MKKHRKLKPTFARRVMGLVCLGLGLVLAVMVPVTAWFQHQINQGRLQPQEALPTLQRFVADNLSAAEETLAGSSVINILLIGQDETPGGGPARSDSIILCTFNKGTKQLTMTSFLRDLYVSIPGFGSNRINAAYAFGGMELLDRTLEENFDVQVDANVEVDFAQFSEIVDALGGVEIQLRADEAKVIREETGTEISEGLQRLNGDQALTYARIRKLDAEGDFGRTSRQRKVLSAVLDRYKTADLKTILSLVDELLPMVNTDMKPMKMMKYAVELFPVLSEVQVVSQHIPAEGTYENRRINEMSVLVADMEATRQLLHDTLTGESSQYATNPN